jgi:hypothetical protein
MSEPTPDPLETAFYTAQASGLSFLSDIGPMILAASYLNIANDTRSFARKFEQAHALVIREVSSLVRELEVLDSEDKSEKSSRVFYQLNDAGRALFDGAP